MSPILIAVVGWFVSPIIRSLLPKILVCLGFDPSNKLQDLEIHIIPELKKTTQAVDQERMMQRGKRVKTDLDALDKMAAMLRHALEDAEDIFDDAQEKIVLRCCHRLYGAFTACIVLCKCCCVWIAHVFQTNSARLLQCARKISSSLVLLRRPEEHVLVNVSAAVVSDEPVQVTIDILASDDPDPVTTTTSAVASGGETVSVTAGAAASDEPDPMTTSTVAYGTVPLTTGAAASDNEAVSVTTSAATSDEPDPVTASAAVSDNEAVSVTTGAVASHEPNPVTASAAVSDNEAVSVTTGAAASDEPNPVTASATVSHNETVPETAGAAASDEPNPVTAVSVPVTTGGAAASDESDPVTTTTSVVASGDATVSVTAGAEASGNEIVLVTTPSDSSGRWRSCLCSSFDFFKNCCTSLYSWLAHVFEAACFYRDWSYEVVGIKKCQENASLFDILDIFLTAISRGKLKKRIQKVEHIVSEVNKSQLLGGASNSTPNDIANKNRRKLGAASKREVFGREVLRDDIMVRLRETPQGDAPRSSQCYSVIGIYGVAGSGKTTFAEYIRDYIKEEYKEKPFDTIMCIHVSETFTVEVIFQEMLKDITGDSHSNISDHGVLNKKLKEALHGKRFFLILDDLWVKNKNDQQLEELISPLNVGLKGSKILVTARTKEAAGALCGDELIEMPDLDEDQYMKMFMHYALSGKSIAVKEFEQVGREIAKKLHQSPIAAVTVAGRLGANPNISFWKNVAKLDMLNDTMDALWWSYKQLNPDIRRCFEFCNIFPRRFKLEKDQLVRLWMAQGFVKTSCAIEEMEDVAEGYIQELVSCSFLQPKGTSSNTDCFAIHDLLHDLANKVAGSDCFGIMNGWGQSGEGWKGDVPRDVRHLFVQKYDGELITKKILGLENLRTLIIYFVASDTPVEEKVIESICMRLPKLRAIAFAFNKIYNRMGSPNDMFLVPESIIQLKHLRYLAFRKSFKCKVILPCTLAKLLHMQLLDFGAAKISEFTCAADLINLRHIFCSYVSFPNIGMLSSLQTIPDFRVRSEQGYEVKQLRDLNKLRGELVIAGLENVKSKKEALEANLAAKERLTSLVLWPDKVEVEVLEGLCPPVGLEKLTIRFCSGSRYPDWMVGRLNGGPKDLQNLSFSWCSQLGPGPELEAFPHLRILNIVCCSWDALPGNMEHLTSLKVLFIKSCKNIRSLPTQPQSLKEFILQCCDDELMKGCQTEGDPNWHKLKHIPMKIFLPLIPSHASEASNVIAP